MSQSPPACPSYHSESVSFNGYPRHGKQNHRCRDCGCQFVLNPQWHPLIQAQRELIDRLLLERISLAGIARVMQRSEDCIQRYVNQKANTVSTQVEVTSKPKKRLSVQMDELWSFVTSKGHEQWVWLALDAETHCSCPLLRSEEHTSELQSHSDLVCRLLLEKKNKQSL